MNPNDPAPLPAAEPAPHAERVRGADGKAYWKLTCFCGKILAPATGPHKQGLCPKCGTSLLFPTDRPITTGPLPVIPADRPKKPEVRKRVPAPATRTRFATTVVTGANKKRESSSRVHPGHSASDNAADKLRPGSARTQSAHTGLVSAWPAAAMGPRALAAFVDLTLALLAAAFLIAAGPALPAHLTSGTFRIAFALIVLWLNEGVSQWLWKGSFGKRLCLIAIRESEGEPLRVENALLRPFVKLVLLPLWPLAYFDPAGRAVHDRILNTVVLKGRASH